MKNKLKYFIPVLIATFVVSGLVWANTFPSTLNDWEYGEYITEDWANALEDKIGVDDSTVVTSLDYLIKNSASKLGSIYQAATTTGYILVADGSKWNSTSTIYINNDGYVGIASTTPFSQFSVTGDSRMAGNLTVTGTITGNLTGNLTGNADTATALATNPTACSVGPPQQLVKDIDANGTLTCHTLVDADIPDTITASSYLSLSVFYGTTTQDSIVTISQLSILMSQISDFDASDILLTSKYMLVGNASNQASSTSAMIIDTNGYVGIATSTPTEELSVGGDIYLSGDINTTNGEVVDFFDKSLYMASSTWEGRGTTTDLWYPSQAIRITEIACVGETAVGTTTIYATDGTNAMDSIVCGYTLVKDSSLSNNTWTADELFRVVIQSIEGTPNFFTLRVKGYYVSD